MAAGAISFFRIGTDGLTAEMRRSGRASRERESSLQNLENPSATAQR